MYLQLQMNMVVFLGEICDALREVYGTDDEVSITQDGSQNPRLANQSNQC